MKKSTHLCAECDRQGYAITMGLVRCKLCKGEMSSSYSHCPPCARRINKCSICSDPIVSKARG